MEAVIAPNLPVVKLIPRVEACFSMSDDDAPDIVVNEEIYVRRQFIGGKYTQGLRFLVLDGYNLESAQKDVYELERNMAVLE